MATSVYHIAWQMTQNYDLMMRVAASARQESEALGAPIDDVEQWAKDRRWDWSTQSDWIAAVQGAQANGISEWGLNPGVIPDQYILSYVQSTIASESQASVE